MPPAAQAADPPELATLEELGAFDRLRHRGVHLSDNARTLLAQVPPRLRLAAVELAASSGEASCPLCGLVLRDADPERRISHLWLHGAGDIDDDGGRRARATKAFSVSASMLGNYFDLRECNRWLHQRAQRGRREPDIESLVDPLRTAHAARGDDFEAQLCTSLRRDGLPAEWEGDAGTANGQRIRFVSVDEYNQLPDTRGYGKFIDLKEEAKRLCGCSSCSCRDEGLPRSAASLVVAAERGGACSLLTSHQNASNKALTHEGGVPTVLYQLMVLPPQNVSGDVALSHGYLDYVILLPTDDGATVRCTVVDAKATDRVKVGAKVQVAYYSWVLEEIANSKIVRYGRERSRAPLLRMSEMGGVWLHGRDAPAPFKLTELKRMVRKSVRDTLPMVLVPSKEAHQQTWQLGPSCLGCDYLNDCKHDAQTNWHVGSLPGLSRRRQLELERAVPGLSEPNALHKLAEFAAQPQPEEPVRRLLSRLLLVSYDGYAPVRLPSVSVQLEERCGGVAVVSPRLAAVCGGEPYLNGTPSLTLPSSEAVALHVVLLEDPRVRRVYAWALRLRDGARPELDSDVCECIRDADDAAEQDYAMQERGFVRQLDHLLTRLNGTRRAIYIAERHEHATLMRTLMAGAMRLGSKSDAGEAAAHPRRCLRCLFTLIALPDLVQLPQQPNLAVTRGGVVPDACVMLAEEVRRMMSLPTPGPWRFDDACANLLHDWRDSPAPPTTELTYAAWRYPRTMGAEAVKRLLQRRLDTGVMLLGTLRRLCAEHSRGTAALLPNMAPAASGEAAGLAMEPEMSKLCFIAELEAHTKHRAMVALRAAPLEHRLAQRRGKTFLLRLVAIVSGDPSSGGSVDIELSAVADVLDEVPVAVGGNEWLLCRNSGEGLVDVMRWGDLDNRRHLKPPWGKDMLRQHNLPPKGHVLLAEVHAVHPADRRVTLRVQCCAAGSGDVVKLTEVELTQGAEYVLQPRYVDFTTSKVVRRLQDDSRLVRESRDPLSAMLLRFTSRVGSMQPTPPAPDLTSDVVTVLPMTESQSAIYNHMCSSVLTLTQGPPGSGKTHFLATAIGRLLIASLRADRPMRVLVTAVTHDALNHLLSKLARMLVASGLLDNNTTRVFKLGHSSGPIEVDCNVRVKKNRPRALQVFRVMALEVGRVLVQASDGEKHEFTEADLVRVDDYGNLSPSSKLTQLRGKQVVLGATVFQMGRIRDKLVDEMADADAGYFDLLVVDEASQMQLSHVLLPLHLLRARPPDDAADDTGGGRLIVVGDTRQMGPILQNEYPDDAQLCEGSPPPHWSLLRWLWERTSSDASHLRRELQENHRMTPHLARFTEHVLGYEGFQVCGKCGCICHAKYEDYTVPLLELSQPDACARPIAVRQALRRTSAFVLIEMKAPPEPTAAIEEEAVLVVELVQSYLARRGQGDDDGVFVVTPHHTQRLAVSRRLELLGVRKGQVCVDTVERMQGQERDLVIVCYGSLIDLDEPGELDFTYSRERLNTAVTRAKKKCVLICASDVLDPSVAACATMERQAGYELLRRISAQCPDHVEDGCVRVRYDASAAAANTQTMDESAALPDQARTAC